MLEGVNKINWKNLGNPNIPRWLEGLTSVDREIRRRAAHRIAVDVVKEDEISDGNLQPTSALSSEIPVYIIPFLIELLASGSISEKGTLINFLNTLATYHIRFKDAEGELGLTKEHLDRASQMFDLVRDGAKTYSKLLRDNDPDIRRYAGHLLDILGLPSEGP